LFGFPFISGGFLFFESGADHCDRQLFVYRCPQPKLRDFFRFFPVVGLNQNLLNFRIFRIRVLLPVLSVFPVTQDDMMCHANTLCRKYRAGMSGVIHFFEEG
jgi:hypothetical protein